jgi:hypothetical protein
MTRNELSPAALAARTGLGNQACVVAAFTPEYSAEALVVQRLERRFRLSRSAAHVIASLAGLGPREVRHG